MPAKLSSERTRVALPDKQRIRRNLYAERNAFIVMSYTSCLVAHGTGFNWLDTSCWAMAMVAMNQVETLEQPMDTMRDMMPSKTSTYCVDATKHPS